MKRKIITSADSASLRAKASLVCILVAMVALTPTPVFAKGFLANPPVSMTIAHNYYSLGPQAPSVTKDEVEVIASLIQSLGTLYNASWRPAIHSLLVNNSVTLDGTWIDRMGVTLNPAVSGFGIIPQYAYGAYVEGVKGGDRAFVIHTLNLSMTDPLIENLVKWNLSMLISFGLSGYYSAFEQTLEPSFAAADPYMHRLTQFGPQIVDASLARLPGTPFGALTISVLNQEVIEVIARNPTDGGLIFISYFGVPDTNVANYAVPTTQSTYSAVTSISTGIALLSMGFALSVLVIVYERRHRRL